MPACGRRHPMQDGRHAPGGRRTFAELLIDARGGVGWDPA